MWLYQYMNLVYPYFEQDKSEADFVPQFFTDVMKKDISAAPNPFLNCTPDFIRRIYNDSKRLDRSKLMLITPKLSLRRMQTLVTKTLTPDGQIEIIEDFETETKNLDNPTPKTSNSKRSTPRAHGFAASPNDQIYAKDGKLFIGANSSARPDTNNIASFPHSSTTNSRKNEHD